MTRWPARRRVDVAAPPEALLRFVASEWPGDVWAAFAAWKKARHDWHDANVAPGGFAPWGDGIDMLLQERDVRRRLPPQPLRPGEHWTNGPPPGWSSATDDP
jgi:hypothetical protein